MPMPLPKLAILLQLLRSITTHIKGVSYHRSPGDPPHTTQHNTVRHHSHPPADFVRPTRSRERGESSTSAGTETAAYTDTHAWP